MATAQAKAHQTSGRNGLHTSCYAASQAKEALAENSKAKFADDRQTVGCRVTEQVQNAKPDVVSPRFQLEIYLRGGRKQTIALGPPILDWHFWKNGQQVAIYSGPGNGQGTYALYESATVRLIEKFAEPTDESLLPNGQKARPRAKTSPCPWAQPSRSSERNG